MLQSVRHHSEGVTEGAMGVFPTLAMTGTTVLLGSSIWEQRRSDKKKIEMKQKISEIEQKILEIEQDGMKRVRQKIERVQQKIENEITKARKNNTDQMSVAWSEMALSRKAVLNKTYKSNLFSDLRELLGMANNSKADETTPAPDSVDDVMQFFLWWKFYQDNKTIDSTRLMKRLGSQFRAFRKILKDIRDNEASDWDEADSDNLSEVVDFLDELSK